VVEEGRQRIQQVQIICEHLRIQVQRAEEEAQANARKEVEDMKAKERQWEGRCEKLCQQFARVREDAASEAKAAEQERIRVQALQLECDRLRSARATSNPTGAPDQKLIQDLTAKLEAAREDAANYRRMVIEEQGRNSELQQQLVDASRAKREATAALREVRRSPTRTRVSDPGITPLR